MSWRTAMGMKLRGTLDMVAAEVQFEDVGLALPQWLRGEARHDEAVNLASQELGQRAFADGRAVVDR